MNIGYARVSTRDQNRALQPDASPKARPGPNRQPASLCKSDAGHSHKPDRLGRSLKHLLNIVAELKFRGVGLVSRTDALNSTFAQGRLVLNLLASLAERERALIRERTHAGRASVRARGRGVVIHSHRKAAAGKFAD